ncbi:MAG: haloacid dehalogenase-like hydrolase [Gemmatimonadota bacterium]|nr:haloacid dehalogenase-like hydrolase [Gemmatimonadota bacterium]
MKLVLFDIDGTLLDSDGAGRRAISRALVEAFGTSGPGAHGFDGKTDPQIVSELMALAGVAPDLVAARMDGVFARYVECLREEIVQPGHAARVYPGVPELLDALEATDDVVLGLLTGNVKPGAEVKLGAVGLAPARFRVGAFGSDHAVRAELPAIAQARAGALLARGVPGRDMVVIGDTPADVTCGRGVGARAIGVATGRYSAADLGAHAPAAVFPDFRDTAAVVRAICSA